MEKLSCLRLCRCKGETKRGKNLDSTTPSRTSRAILPLKWETVSFVPSPNIITLNSCPPEMGISHSHLRIGNFVYFLWHVCLHVDFVVVVVLSHVQPYPCLPSSIRSQHMGDLTSRTTLNTGFFHRNMKCIVFAGLLASATAFMAPAPRVSVSPPSPI